MKTYFKNLWRALLGKPPVKPQGGGGGVHEPL
jgi:hypothetical protein